MPSLIRPSPPPEGASGPGPSSARRQRHRCFRARLWRACALALAAAVFACAAPPALACSSSISKRPARPRAPPATPPSPSGSATSGAQRPAEEGDPQPRTEPRANVTFPTYACPHPYSEYYCLNDAKCFTVIIQDTPLYNCECKEGFVGQRCEYKDLEGSYLLSKGSVMIETASIATGAFFAFLLAGLVCFGAWVALTARAKVSKGSDSSSARLRTSSRSSPPSPPSPPSPQLVLRTSNA